VTDHGEILRAIQYGLEYDQVDGFNLCLVEHLLRRAQMIEYYHRERLRQELSLGTSSAKGSAAGVEFEEQNAFLGTSGSDGALMVCPELMSFVSKEMERQSAVDKQSRKAREERALRRK
jgi:hypothetical protein